MKLTFKTQNDPVYGNDVLSIWLLMNKTENPT